MYATHPHVHETLGELIQSQPRDLFKHSHAVARMASNLSGAAGCSSAEQQRIWAGSLLHDIGKQFIPLSILEKKGRLSPAEFHRIQEHAWLGYAYLNNFVSDPIILNTVLYHHERWNGTGYPYGFEGEQIPLGARICALADVWDALVSIRCYRSAWSMTQAMDLIWASAGSQFDPQLTLQFLTMIEEEYSHAGCTDAQEAPVLSVAGRNAPAYAHLPLAALRGGPSAP